MDDDLIHAYRATDYRVYGSPPFKLRVGAASTECDALMLAQGVISAAYLTAWNPHSSLVSEVENIAAQDRLRQELSTAGFAALDGEGVGHTGDWPPEPSLLVLGIPRNEATRLARKYRQNAFLWIARGQATELVLCT